MLQERISVEIDVILSIDGTNKLVKVKERLTIGRSLLADIQINDHSVSRIHAALHVNQESELFIEDLDSKNGTFLNSENVHPNIPYLISIGDVVKIGILQIKLLGPLNNGVFKDDDNPDITRTVYLKIHSK